MISTLFNRISSYRKLPFFDEEEYKSEEVYTEGDSLIKKKEIDEEKEEEIEVTKDTQKDLLKDIIDLGKQLENQKLKLSVLEELNIKLLLDQTISNIDLTEDIDEVRFNVDIIKIKMDKIFNNLK